VAIGVIPLHFILNLTRHLYERGCELVPESLAYRALQCFLAFSILQTIEFTLFPVIPGWLTALLMQILPRYSGLPYNSFGIRGVQGWASEPSSAALTCAAFAIIAIRQSPQSRWRIVLLFLAFLLVNKSLYALILAVFLCIYNVVTLRRKAYAVLALVAASGGTLVYALASERLADLRTEIVLNGTSSANNESFKRFGQIIGPFLQFPHIYKPVRVVFATATDLEPLGLLPVLLGYGSFFGIAWLVYVFRHNFPFRRIRQRFLVLMAAFILLIMASPDFIPSIVSLAVLMFPPKFGSSVAHGDPQGLKMQPQSERTGGPECALR
jgi:hypothetical protein